MNLTMIEAMPSKHSKQPRSNLLGSPVASRARVAGTHPSERPDDGIGAARPGFDDADRFAPTAQEIAVARRCVDRPAGMNLLPARNSLRHAHRHRRSRSLEDFLTVKEVAEICHVSTKTTRR